MVTYGSEDKIRMRFLRVYFFTFKFCKCFIVAKN